MFFFYLADCTLPEDDKEELMHIVSLFKSLPGKVRLFIIWLRLSPTS